MDMPKKLHSYQTTSAVSNRNSGKLAPWILLCIGFMASTGCSICCPGYLDDYATVGGKWQRTDPAFGRVGSPMSDVGSMAGEVILDSTSDSTETIYESNGEVYYEDAGSHIESTEDYDDGVVILGEP